jgi:hypothetical protein
MKVYLDVCCVNRPFDDQTQDRIRLESEAVLLILRHIASNKWEWVSSEVVDFEILQTPNMERRARTWLIVQRADHKVLVDQAVVQRGREMEAMGFGPYDSLHVACAERGKVDVFLTTDDRLIALALRHSSRLEVKVSNPLLWIREVIGNEGGEHDS